MVRTVMWLGRELEIKGGFWGFEFLFLFCCFTLLLGSWIWCFLVGKGVVNG